ncbi:RagB/SusD family nutrient uptake outer membrane protein [Bacteroides sp. 214]|uniref:RagB/SusD family nutrient uptake outer membrane protein n=1 Tax=Bacteroides sp. 214 TaxID=2302935 RepID=UPI0013D28D6C|nr:RagB/SusD family nutrient uptake outer membrane protein [Bacteroides sp. 214]NDW12658.1 RagB/SusD family nutrient uptake outer membrane protein [Bacteroides sp. 214]
MKKLYTFVAILSFTLLAGCSDFLEQDNKSNVPGADYYNTPAGFESLCNAAYSSLRTIYSKDPWLFEGGTDLFASGRTSVQVCNLYGQNYSSAEENVTTFYKEHYKAISLANEVIYWGDGDDNRAERVAEARGLRAFYYLNLVQQFGGVPLSIDRATSPITSLQRESSETVFQFIINELTDLTSASSSLAEKSADGRFTKTAAKHYLAKAYLCKGYLTNDEKDFNAAIASARSVGAGNPLNTPFATLFSNQGEGNEEVLFFIDYNIATVANVQSDGNRQQADYGPYLRGAEAGHKYTSSTLTPTLWMHEVFNTNTDNPAQDERYEATFMLELRQSYWDYYDENKKNSSEVIYYYCPSWEISNIANWRSALDSRKNATVVEMLPEGNNISNEQTSYQAKMSADICGVAPFRKFDDVENGKKYFKITSSMRDIYLARLAETNLIAAEACVKLNKPEDAVSYINVVRNRAKATPAIASEVNIDYILNERARELAGEYHRWTDLTRTGKLAEYVETHNPDIPSGRITSKFYLRPIPLAAIELNPALVGHQNEGW